MSDATQQVKKTGNALIDEVLESGSKVRLADLNDRVVKTLVELDAKPTEAQIKKIGDPVVAAGLLEFYTAERYSGGRWISKATLRAIVRAVEAASEPEPETEDEPETTEPEGETETADAS